MKNVTGLTKFLYLNFRTFQTKYPENLIKFACAPRNVELLVAAASAEIVKIPNGDIEEFDVQTAKNYWTNLISPNGGGKSLTVKQDSRMFQGAFEKGYTNYKPCRKENGVLIYLLKERIKLGEEITYQES